MADFQVNNSYLIVLRANWRCEIFSLEKFPKFTMFMVLPLSEGFCVVPSRNTLLVI